MSHSAVQSPKKLIEVALPLNAINEASVREGYIYRGNPSSLHKWWAQRPLAAARAIIYAQLVNDPSWKWELENPGERPPNHLKATWQAQRQRHFSLIQDLVKWENMNNASLLARAHEEIAKSWRETCEVNAAHPDAEKLFNAKILPGLHDPFAGGGTIPLEAKRLGLTAHASDLNPVATLLNMAILTLPERFAGASPVGPECMASATQLPNTQQWNHALGIAEDIRRYGDKVATLAASKLANLYPSILITDDEVAERSDLAGLAGETVPVIAYLWARTVRSPNPAFRHVHVPLLATYVLSNKAGAEVYLDPIVAGDSYELRVRNGAPPDELSSGTKAGRASFRCILSDAPISAEYIKSEGVAGQIAYRMTAVVVESRKGRVYLKGTQEQESLCKSAEPLWKPAGALPNDPRAFTPILYGMREWADLYLPRQLTSISTLIDAMKSIRDDIVNDFVSNKAKEKATLEDGERYADLISTYIMFAVDKHCMYGNSLVPWFGKENRPSFTFTQQTVQMTWDFCELNPLSDVGGSFRKSVSVVSQSAEGIVPNGVSATVAQASALDDKAETNVFVSTDPPYYDNVPYADLSDFFYSWMRCGLREIYPDLFSTLQSPKGEELVAAPYRHGGKESAEQFFMAGMTSAIQRLASNANPATPITLYYAFKQSETRGREGTISTGWVTFLSAIISSGLSITGTWPVRTERQGRQRDAGSNALASSIVLVCRPRAIDAPSISRREFVRELNAALPEALDQMTRGYGSNTSAVAPVDLSQAIIGPGIGIFSKYSSVLEADGTEMKIEAALRLINKFVAEDDFDPDSQFCLHWFEHNGWDQGAFGDADQLARAKGTAVNAVQAAGVISAGLGKVRLLKWSEYPSDWNPASDLRLPIWEALHHLIRVLKSEGESGAGATLAKMSAKADPARQLAYRLYTFCERSGWAEDARAYNEVITSWSAIEDAAARSPAPRQTTLFDR